MPLNLANKNFGEVVGNMKKKINWVAWDKMQKSKWDGGMGFRDLHHFNLSLLAKQVWRILQNPKNLWVKLLKLFYFFRGSFLNSKSKSNCSWVWKSIIKGRDLLSKGLHWRVGNRKKIDIWKDPWVPITSNFKLTPFSQESSLVYKVSQFIDTVFREWNLSRINHLIPPCVANSIHRIPLPQSKLNYKMVWTLNKKGIFSVKLAYFISTSSDPQVSSTSPHPSHVTSPPFPWKSIWALNVPPKVKHFL